MSCVANEFNFQSISQTHFMPSSLTTRINNIQSLIGVPQTGAFDAATCNELLARGNKTANTTDLKTLIKMVQRMVNADDDGVPGSETVTKVEAFVAPVLPKPPVGASMVLSKKSIGALIEFEVTSKQVYEIRFQKPMWPGGESGVTIGIGYDLAFPSKNELANTWGPLISATDLSLLDSVRGISKTPAKAAAQSIKSVKIPFDKAIQVFHLITLPNYAGKTKRLYPGIQKLPPDAQGALLSLVYNRGTSIKGETRTEMKNIIKLVENGDLDGIAAQIRSMKRIWKNKNLSGLISRREKEAQLVENASFNILPEDLIIV